MRNIQTLTMDINKKCTQIVTANTGEAGTRFVRVNIVDNGLPFNLDGLSVLIYAKKTDGNKVFNNVTIEDSKNGVVLAELTSKVLAIEGFVKLALLIREGQKKLATKIFTLKVDESIVDEDAIESSNEFGALTGALSKVDEWNGYFDENSGKIEEKYTERLNKVSSDLEHNAKEISEKANKIDTYKKLDVDNKIWSMANMGQDVKESMTNGSVAVVAENSVLSENIVSQQIIKEKTNFFNYYENLLDTTVVHVDKVWYWATSTNSLTTLDSTGHACYNRIRLYGGITYSVKDIRGGSLLVSLDLKSKIGEISTSAMFTGTYTPTKDCWLYPYYYTATNISSIMIVNSSEYWCIGANVKLDYGKKYKRTIGDIDLDNVLNDISNIYRNLPSKINAEAMYEQIYNFIDLKYKFDFALGSLSNSGGYFVSDKRICTKSMQYADTDIILSTDYTKYRISVYIYDDPNSTATVNSGWITNNSYTIPKGSYYMVQTGGLNDAITFDEIYNECFNAVKFKTSENLDQKLNNIKSSEKPLKFCLSPSTTRIIMHRGYSFKAPDNSISSFTLAGQTEECWGIETDVRVLVDGTIVCFHDTELDSHTTGTGDILDKSYAEIQDVVYDSGVAGLEQYPNEKIALFSDYLKICRKYCKVAVVELKPQKNVEDVDKVVEIVNSFGMRNSVIYISFDKEYIDRVLEIDNKSVVQKLYLANDSIDYDNFSYDSIGLEIQDWGQTDENILETNLRKLQKNGVLVSTWTTDTSTTKRSLENKCVDFITTNLIN